MNKTITIILVILFNINSFSQAGVNDNNLESKSIFELKINSEKYTLIEGDELILDSKLKKPKISIKLLDLKKFNNGNISFDYPSNFSFEFEESEGYKNWTFDGNDYAIMIFDIDGETEVIDFINNMISQFGKEKCKTENVQIEIGNRKLDGIKLSVELAGQNLTIDFLQYESLENNSKYIALQDTKNEDGSPSAESIETFKIINSSLIYY